MFEHTRTPKRRRWLIFGPGTLIALIAGAGIFIASRWTHKTTPDLNAGPIIYEANVQGQLRRVGAPSAVQESRPKLWKPEPSFLVENASALKLTARQTKAITAVSVNWLNAKTRLDLEINRATTQASERFRHKTESPNFATAARIGDSFGDYSKLSRSFNELRAAHWRQGLAYLTAEQHKRLDVIVELNRSTKLP